MSAAVSGREDTADAEVPLQLQVRPVVQGLPTVAGTVFAHARNLSRSGASPVISRSATPQARMARHL